MIYALMGNTMHPEPVFIIMALFNTIRIPVTKNLPNAVGAGAEAMVAINRVLDILQLEEKSHACNTKKSESLSIGSVQLKNLTVKWSQKQEEPSLSNVDLFIKPQETVMVIGSVGSGKTCLLWSLLNEVDIVSGSVSINGVTSYSPQESWSFGSSIKDNIVMSDTFDAEKYKQVIFSCGLEKDMQSFPKGDETFVGEKGYSLSGGQKARVTLARCAYHESDVYLLDDPLSAVDPQVANHIFDNLIKGYLKNKTVILVTHQLQFVDRVDRIVVMKDGTVESVGTYDELINNGKSSLSALMKNMRQEEEKCHDLQRQKSLSVHSFSQDSVVESMEDTPSQSQQTSGESNIQSEDRTEQSSTGSLSFQVYWKYFSSGGSVSLVVITLIISLASQSLSHFSDLFLSAWTQRRDFKLTNSSLDESILSEDFIFDEQYKNVIVYSILSLLLFVSTLARAILSFILCLRCSIKIHNNVFKSVLRSPMFFFETNPLGRILNRLTRDIGVIDQGIPAVIAELNMSVFSILGILGTSIAVNYWLAIPTFVLTAVSIPIRRYYIRTAREIQRLDSITKSPVFSHIDTMFDGLVTIRAFKLEDKFLKQFVGKVHDSVSCRFLVIIASRIMGLLVDSMTTVYIFALVVLLMSLPKGFISGGDAGVMLSSSLLLIGMFQNCVRTTVDFETQMISVERLFEYQRLDAEDQLEKPTDKFEELKNWPSEGRVVFKDVSMRYFPEGPLVLKNISFSINAAEKIGVVGRTGAGKSSLLTVLFRLIEVSDGTIFIDDQDVSKLGLHLLRGSMSIIPQDPSLFSGTIRRNLDPFSEYQDDQMWTVMKEANLTDNQLTLDSVVTEGGSNLSVGQRQLLCLARALLNNNRILLMDEATANVDQQTDNIIQRTIKATFKESTVITVAHRLNTVIDMDRVLVMDYGRVVEFDEPHHLLQNPNGYFFDMVRQTGIKFQKMLIEMARHHYYKRHGLPC
jgi:ATP-binding cassette subfamily C (CFTR/MRP) protein 4